MGYKNKYLIIITGLIVVFFLLSCEQTKPSRFESVLGTVCVITLYEQGYDRIYNDIFSRIKEIEDLMSVNIQSSDISRINAAAGIEAVQVHADTFKVIQRAVFFAEASDGVFDPTIGPLVSLWDIGENPRIPSQHEIEDILPLINWRNIKLDTQTNSVFLKYMGMALDLGAIAKGFAADEAAKIAKTNGITAAILDLGGDIVILGEKKDKSPWRVGIQSPHEVQNTPIGFVQITDKLATVVTSGIYQRFFEAHGKHYHHIFSPSNGYPVDNDLLSVTVISDISMDADALSTAIFVLGYEKGMALLELFPKAEAIFIFKDNNIKTTAGTNFILTDTGFVVRSNIF
ncbi:MAG: FAD:protein FMN transferase [Treponema sp.]|nr:FAD:protein FMN transferase [Treponema sp.]